MKTLAPHHRSIADQSERPGGVERFAIGTIIGIALLGFLLERFLPTGACRNIPLGSWLQKIETVRVDLAVRSRVFTSLLIPIILRLTYLLVSRLWHFGGRPDSQSPDAARFSLARYAKEVALFGSLILLSGIIIGNMFGYSSYVRLSEGQEVAKIPGRSGADNIEIPFRLKNDRLTMTNPDIETDRRCSSDVSIVGKEGDILQRPVTAADPLTFRGVSVRHVDCGISGPPSASVIAKETPGERIEMLTLLAGKSRDLPGVGRILATRLGMKDSNGEPYVELILERGNAQDELIRLAPGEPHFIRNRKVPFYLMLTEVRENRYAGLIVSRDPGAPLVFAGCLVLILSGTISILKVHSSGHRNSFLPRNDEKGDQA
jgi:hypothetical protein